MPVDIEPGDGYPETGEMKGCAGDQKDFHCSEDQFWHSAWFIPIVLVPGVSAGRASCKEEAGVGFSIVSEIVFGDVVVGWDALLVSKDDTAVVTFNVVTCNGIVYWISEEDTAIVIFDSIFAENIAMWIPENECPAPYVRDVISWDIVV